MIQIEWDIIEKKLQGKLTLEEERLFDTWRSETSVNDDYFRKIEKFYRENGFVKEVWDEDMEVSWDRLQGRLKRDLRPKRKLGWYWAASGVVACLVLGMVWFMMMRQQILPEIMGFHLCKNNISMPRHMHIGIIENIPASRFDSGRLFSQVST